MSANEFLELMAELPMQDVGRWISQMVLSAGYEVVFNDDAYGADIWRHANGFEYHEDNPKHAAVLAAHLRAGTTPPPF